MNTSKSIPIQYTKDYARFEMDAQNRDPRPDKTLEASFRQYGYLPEYPLICSRNGGGKLHIHAGHHRYLMAQRFDTGVWYMVVEPRLTIFEREASSHSRWSVEDFMTAYAKAGNEEYIQALTFAKEHNLSPAVAAIILRGDTSVGTAHAPLKNGTFAVRDREFAEAVVAISDDLYALGVPFATSRSFVMALAQLVRVEEFKPAWLVQRATLYAAQLRKRPSIDDYLEEIEAFYNYGLRSDQRLPLAHLAKQAAAKRNPVVQS